jgi:hypothetical protein
LFFYADTNSSNQNKPMSLSRTARTRRLRLINARKWGAAHPPPRLTMRKKVSTRASLADSQYSSTGSSKPDSKISDEAVDVGNSNLEKKNPGPTGTVPQKNRLLDSNR